MPRRSPALALRRFVQTPLAFSNWPQIYWGLARSGLGSPTPELRFHTRKGQQIALPNAPGARVPAYEMFAEDCYDLAWFLGELAHRPVHVLDVGAHVGTFTCWLCHVNPDATVDCYEPSSDTVRFTRRNVAANGLGGRATVHEAALAGETGWAVFEHEGAGSGLNHLDFDGAGSKTGVRVETVSFDDAVRAAPRPVEVVKMDCEGGEYDLVYASDPGSWAEVRRLVLEYHQVDGQHWSDLRSWFADVGLHVLDDQSVTPGLGVAWLSRDPADPRP